MHIINTLAPVFLIIFLGAVLNRVGFLKTDFAKGINRLAYWVGLPCLLFYKISQVRPDFNAAGKTFLVVFAATIICLAAGYIAAFLMRIPPASRGTFVQGSFRSNHAYISLAIIIYSLSGLDAVYARNTEAVAILVLSLIVPIYNVLSVTVLLISRHELNRGIFKKVTKGIITNPLIIACVLGIIYSYMFDSLPTSLSRSCAALGYMALPLALLGIGVSIADKKTAPNKMTYAIAASLIKTILSPIAGYFIAIMTGLGQGEMLVAMILLSAPTAVASYVMTQEIGGDTPLSVKIVVVSTILSIISLATAVGLF